MRCDKKGWGVEGVWLVALFCQLIHVLGNNMILSEVQSRILTVILFWNGYFSFEDGAKVKKKKFTFLIEKLIIFYLDQQQSYILSTVSMFFFSPCQNQVLGFFLIAKKGITLWVSGAQWYGTTLHEHMHPRRSSPFVGPLDWRLNIFLGWDQNRQSGTFPNTGTRILSI